MKWRLQPILGANYPFLVVESDIFMLYFYGWLGSGGKAIDYRKTNKISAKKLKR